MTPKELLYIEDALGHTKFLMDQCNDAVAKLQDPALKQSVSEYVAANQKLFTRFYGLV